MWFSSHWLADGRRHLLTSVLAGACLSVLIPPVHASAQPPLMAGPPAGEATLRFLGLQVYRARLWASPAFNPGQLGSHALALELEYLRAFKGSAIADRSIAEMRRVGAFTETQALSWNAAMQQVFPDVRPGDRLTGVHHPGQGAEFLHNDHPAGRIDDPEFARLFFSIWLSPNTSEPGLRRQLLARWLDNPR